MVYPLNTVLEALPGASAYPTMLQVALIVIALAGTGLRYWAMFTLGQRFTSTLRTVNDHKVESRGPYAWIRHPGYTANGLAMLPFTILASPGRPLVPLICTLMYLAIYLYRIHWEEQMLLHTLGAAYERYQRTTTKRLVPFMF